MLSHLKSVHAFGGTKLVIFQYTSLMEELNVIITDGGQRRGC